MSVTLRYCVYLNKAKGDFYISHDRHNVSGKKGTDNRHRRNASSEREWKNDCRVKVTLLPFCNVRRMLFQTATWKRTGTKDHSEWFRYRLYSTPNTHQSYVITGMFVCYLIQHDDDDDDTLLRVTLVLGHSLRVSVFFTDWWYIYLLWISADLLHILMLKMTTLHIFLLV